jgi:predicted SnoaL-like aldol condensation-catalyzing enzyme
MEKIESGMRLVIAFNEAFNRHDLAGMMQLTSDDCVFEDTAPAPDGTLYTGKAAIAEYWQGFFTASPQAHIKVEEMLGVGIRCIMRWRYDWVDAAGNPGHVRGMDMFRVQNGLITEKLSYVKG